MIILKSLNLALAFLLELFAVGALFYWGFQTGSSQIVKIILGIGAPLLLIVIWGRFLGPRSPVRLRDPLLTVVKLIVFGSSAAALAVAGQPNLALVFAIVAVVNLALAYLWKQH